MDKLFILLIYHLTEQFVLFSNNIKSYLYTMTELWTWNTEIHQIIIKAINAVVAAPFCDIE